MKWRRGVGLFVCLWIIEAQGFNVPFEGYPAFNLAGPMLGQAFSTKPMQKGQTDLKVAPLQFTHDRAENLPPSGSVNPVDTSVEGYGVVVAGLRTTHENDWGKFGFGWLGGYFTGEGQAIGIASDVGNSTIAMGDLQSDGLLLALTANMDVGERLVHLPLPMFVGLSYMSVTQEKQTSTTIPVSAGETAEFTGDIFHSRKLEAKSPALTLGISARIEVSDYVRLIPFALHNRPLKALTQSESIDNRTTGQAGVGQIADFTRKQAVSSLGLEWAIPRWDVGARIILPVGEQGTGTRVATLTWTKSWTADGE